MGIGFVKSTSDFEGYLDANKYLIANFTATWCGPCQQIKPLIDGIYEDASTKKIEFVRVDIDSQRDLAQRFGITSVPTFIFFKNKQEIHRIRGADVREIHERISSFSQEAEEDTTAKERSGNNMNETSIASNPLLKDIKTRVPKGFDVLNTSIHFIDFQALNCHPLDSQHGEVKGAFKTDVLKISTIMSDADSQLLFFLPLNNICKVHSILIKFRPVSDILSEANAESLELDEDELQSETQPPLLLKVWVNKDNILSFDDASNDTSAPYVGGIDLDDSNWATCKLKYVRFQNVKTLNIFIDGKDEDFHTLIEKIVLIGVAGDSSEQGTLQKLED